MKKDGKIHIKGRKRAFLAEDKEPIIRVSREAYNKLIEIVNESSESMSSIASELIIQGSELIVYDREED